MWIHAMLRWFYGSGRENTGEIFQLIFQLIDCMVHKTLRCLDVLRGGVRKREWHTEREKLDCYREGTCSTWEQGGQRDGERETIMSECSSWEHREREGWREKWERERVRWWAWLDHYYVSECSSWEHMDRERDGERNTHIERRIGRSVPLIVSVN